MHDSYWIRTMPPWIDRPSGEGSLPYDVCVVGGGAMGASTAYWLTQLGRRPLVLERNDTPSQGASGRNGGFMVQGANPVHAEAVELYGHDEARSLYRMTQVNQELAEAVVQRENIHGAYTRATKVDLAFDEREEAYLRESVTPLRHEGVDAFWAPRSEVAEFLGTGVGPHISGGLVRRDQATLHSTRFVLGVADAARQHGATFVCKSPVIEIVPRNQGWRVVTETRVYDVPQVVVAVNAWAPELLPDLEPFLTLIRGHLLLTEATDLRLSPWSINDTATYGRQVPSGQLLVGGMRSAVSDADIGQKPRAGESGLDTRPAIVDALRRVLPDILPTTEGLGVDYAWAGVMDFTPDRLPLAGPYPGREGLWLMVGFSGHGMPYSLALPARSLRRVWNRSALRSRLS
ncbi:FAD-dependent oxidoreductase [Streptomyces antimycoticus]|uniref:FAD-dependent oxidoreductase n=1 Tax=Streptomyces antimycoticus TaxID=68175 RepID=A0A499UKI4_9ACTN|nr:FAD-dependent oxidoreductase [Streptomyces antimycoticus]BBJ37346.1 FAD-dependent oxidoreductase [Streptomyces antimycoticus]